MAGVVTLRPPKAGEAGMLTELCLRSKAHWGYDEAFITACRAELTLTEDDLAVAHVRVAQLGGAVAGLVEISIDGEKAVLEKIFVEPAFIGNGVGRLMMGWAVETARAAGAARMTIDADPGAAPFYRKHGGVDAGTVPSGSIPGRFLPHLVITL